MHLQTPRGIFSQKKRFLQSVMNSDFCLKRRKEDCLFFKKIEELIKESRQVFENISVKTCISHRLDCTHQPYKERESPALRQLSTAAAHAHSVNLRLPQVLLTLAGIGINQTGERLVQVNVKTGLMYTNKRTSVHPARKSRGPKAI